MKYKPSACPLIVNFSDENLITNSQRPYINIQKIISLDWLVKMHALSSCNEAFNTFGLTEPTSISSLYFNNGASIRFLNWNVSDSISRGCLVTVDMRSQCRGFIALLDIISRSGQLSLKSSMVFFKSINACQSLSAFGSLRILKFNHIKHHKNHFFIIGSILK